MYVVYAYFTKAGGSHAAKNKPTEPDNLIRCANADVGETVQKALQTYDEVIVVRDGKRESKKQGREGGLKRHGG